MVIPSQPTEEGYVVVLGGSNVDIEGRSSTTMKAGDSNIGTVHTSPGGVGRNIAENLARLQVRTRLITVVGRDSNGRWLNDETERAGVDMTHVVWAEHMPTSTYLSILDNFGELSVAINDMSALRLLDEHAIRAVGRVIAGSVAVVLDCNLSADALEETIQCIGNVPLFVDTVSTAKAGRIVPHLDRVHTLKPNRVEAELLSGVTINTRADLETAAGRILRYGVQRVVISLGSGGVFYGDGEGHGTIAPPTGRIESATGAGDALMAGLVYAQIRGHSLMEGARLAVAAATLTARSDRTVAPDLSVEAMTELANALSQIQEAGGGVE